MKKLVFIMAAAGIIFSAGCRKWDCVTGNQHLSTSSRSLPNFSKVRLEGSFNVYMEHDSVQEVWIEAESNLLPYIETGVSGNTMVVKTDDHRCIRNTDPVNIYIRSPRIDEVVLNGSGDMYHQGFSLSSLELLIDGSGDMIVSDASVGFLDATISGSGDIFLQGVATDTDLAMDGSGDIHALNLYQSVCSVDIDGSGDVYTQVNDELYVHIDGSGNVYYRGNPSVNVSISGSGKLIKY